jgi:hypothetical protein
MGGGLMQLVAYGAQDIYLTGNPQITFFKVVYRRHTNFSMECIEQTLNGATAIATTSGSSTVTMSRNGDLVSGVYVRCNQGALTASAISGDNLISSVELDIGCQTIDKHTQEWLKMWVELTTPESKAAGYKYMTGGFSNTRGASATVALGGTAQNSIQVPLQFWFCRNPGLALPLIALQYHEVQLKFNWGAADATGQVARDNSTGVTPALEVWVDYIYLDTDERRRFAQVSHEYLIEQLQYQDEGADKTSFELNFNHPVKELLWTADATTGTEWGAQKCKLVLNGHDRFADQAREYFQVRQPYEYHTAVPGFNIKERERPHMIQPINTGIRTIHYNARGETTANLTETHLRIHEDTETAVVAYGLVGGFRVGDILLISMGKNVATALTGDEMVDTHYVSIASIKIETSGDIELTFATPIFSGHLGTWHADRDEDGMSVHVIGRSQEPMSRCSQLAKDISCYSFALKPEEHQPSGTCNFSRIDNAQLQFDTICRVDTIYAVNYNVLRIMSGMGGLAYSN